MILDRLILDDFLTYDHLDYAFEKRPLQVQGLNLTDDKQKTNGAGKSGIQTGIETCITATNSRGVRDDEIVTYGKKQARAQLFASCDVRKQSLHIDWTIKVKGSNRLELHTKEYGSDEWIPVSFSNVNDGKKWITSWFAISKEDLFNYYIINKTRFKSFFNSSNKEKVDLINRFSDASIVEGLEKIDKEDLEGKYRVLEEDVNKGKGKVESTKEALEREKSRDLKSEMNEELEELEDEIEEVEGKIEKAKARKISQDSIIDEADEEIESYKQDIVTASKDKLDIEKEIDDMSTNVTEAETSVTNAEIAESKFKSTDWNAERKDYELDLNDDENTLAKFGGEKAKLDTQESQLVKFVKKLNLKLQGIIVCPKCSHEWVEDEDMDLEEIRTKQKAAEGLATKIAKEQETVDEKIAKIKRGMDVLNDELSKINDREKTENESKNELSIALLDAKNKLAEIERKATRLQNELNQTDVDIKSYQTEIENCNTTILNAKKTKDNIDIEIKNYEAEIGNYRTQIKNYKVGNNDQVIKDLKEDLEKYEFQLKEKEKEFENIGNLIYERNQWSTNFKQFRMFLANQSLEVIEYHTNRYLDGMGSDMRVKLEGYKVLANGKDKEEITAKVIRNRERTFNSFSGGEQGRLLFASILANRHMINESHPYGGLDFLSVDEVFEGVDSLGLKHLIEAAKGLGITIMIITHVTDEETDSDTLLVVKENDISRLGI